MRVTQTKVLSPDQGVSEASSVISISCIQVLLGSRWTNKKWPRTGTTRRGTIELMVTFKSSDGAIAGQVLFVSCCVDGGHPWCLLSTKNVHPYLSNF